MVAGTVSARKRRRWLSMNAIDGSAVPGVPSPLTADRDIAMVSLQHRPARAKAPVRRVGKGTGAHAPGGVPTTVNRRTPSSSPRNGFAVIARGARACARLEGWPQALVAHPSRLAQEGEHLRMTAVYGWWARREGAPCPPYGFASGAARTCRHASGNCASVIGGFGLGRNFGGFGCSTESLNQ